MIRAVSLYGWRKRMGRRRSQNVHTISCMHAEPGVTICCCWLDLEQPTNEKEQDDDERTKSL